MISDIIQNCWKACSMDKSGFNECDERVFHPHAIISNPVTYGHFHCAEKLGIPLHLMFPQVNLSFKSYLYFPPLFFSQIIRYIAMGAN